MGRRWIRSLKTRVGLECSISKGALDCTVEVYMWEESEEGVTVLRVGTQQGGNSKSSEFAEGKL